LVSGFFVFILISHENLIAGKTARNGLSLGKPVFVIEICLETKQKNKLDMPLKINPDK
jgi:hypothetical protein